MKSRVVIFDLDDTLYPEVQYLHSGLRAAAATLAALEGLPPGRTYSEFTDLYRADRAAPVFDRWLEGHGLFDPSLRDRLVSVYREHRPTLDLYCDAAWALQHFGRQHSLGLLTDGRSVTQRNKIDALGVGRFFQQILISDEVGAGIRKPSPLGFTLLLQRMVVSPRHAVYVADNPAKDFAGPRALGMQTVRIRRPCGLHLREEAPSPDHMPDAEVSSLFALAGLLETA